MSLPEDDVLDLLDYRRRIAEIYSKVRDLTDPLSGWQFWRDERDEIFRSHPQSSIPAPERPHFGGLHYFDYNPEFRVIADVSSLPEETLNIRCSGDATYAFTRFARASFDLDGDRHSLSLYWLESYGGGLFVSFKDATSGKSTYGACRYLLDTAKGADLGSEGDRLVFDFNFAYQPSCSYDPRWVCPLAPPDNHLSVAVTAGERVEPREGPPSGETP